MTTELWKLEKDLCRCCHSEGAFKSLYGQHVWLDIEAVVYSDMLRDCFDIELAAVKEPLHHVLCSICDICIQRLRDATDFKHQVQDCEKKFRDLYLRHADSVFEVKIKKELPDSEDDDDIKVDIFPHNGPRADQGSNAISDDEKRSDDDFGMIDRGDDDDFEPDEEEEIPVKVRKKTIHKKTKMASSKVKKKKIGRPKKHTAPPKDDEIVDTIQGVINVVKRSPLSLQEDIDYKRVGDLFICSKCEREHKSINNLRYHIRKVHLKIPKYTCTNCSKRFLTLAPFIKHKFEEHNIDDRLKCNACDNIFNTRVQLRKHINCFHMLGAKYKCDVCDYESFSVESLYKHKFKHKTVKDYHCAFCKKSFLRKTTLQLHERIHTGDRRKVCKECGQAFVQKASLNYHMTKYHPEVSF